MCEFKIIKKNDGSQLFEDIVILSYTEDSELVFKDVLGIGETLKSALIVDVNTISQTCVILEHPLVGDFIELLNKVNNRTISKPDINIFQEKLNELKMNL
ncbi:MAG: hypothetical protein ACXABG_15620 [Promethearchaeota archaeon]|jgi:predicted RNA-binding protein